MTKATVVIKFVAVGGLQKSDITEVINETKVLQGRENARKVFFVIIICFTIQFPVEVL